MVTNSSSGSSNGGDERRGTSAGNEEQLVPEPYNYNIYERLDALTQRVEKQEVEICMLKEVIRLMRHSGTTAVGNCSGGSVHAGGLSSPLKRKMPILLSPVGSFLNLNGGSNASAMKGAASSHDPISAVAAAPTTEKPRKMRRKKRRALAAVQALIAFIRQTELQRMQEKRLQQPQAKRQRKPEQEQEQKEGEPLDQEAGDDVNAMLQVLQGTSSSDREERRQVVEQLLLWSTTHGGNRSSCSGDEAERADNKSAAQLGMVSNNNMSTLLRVGGKKLLVEWLQEEVAALEALVQNDGGVEVGGSPNSGSGVADRAVAAAQESVPLCQGLLRVLDQALWTPTEVKAVRYDRLLRCLYKILQAVSEQLDGGIGGGSSAASEANSAVAGLIEYLRSLWDTYRKLYLLGLN